MASQPAGTGARFLFVTKLWWRGGCQTGAKVLISGSFRDQMAQSETWNCELYFMIRRRRNVDTWKISIIMGLF